MKTLENVSAELSHLILYKKYRGYTHRLPTAKIGIIPNFAFLLMFIRIIIGKGTTKIAPSMSRAATSRIIYATISFPHSPLTVLSQLALIGLQIYKGVTTTATPYPIEKTRRRHRNHQRKFRYPQTTNNRFANIMAASRKNVLTRPHSISFRSSDC